MRSSKRNNLVIQAAVCAGIIAWFYFRHRGGVGVFDGKYFWDIRVPWLEYDAGLRSHLPFLLAAIAGWAVFSLYWEAAAKNAAEAKNTESSASRGIHVFLTNAAFVLEIIPVRGLGRFVPVSALIMAAGLGVEAMGLGVAIWARGHLGRNWSGRIAIKVGHELVRSGPYKRVRHPIYTGILAMYAGVALVTGEWLALIGLAMVVYAYWRKLRLEEAALRAAFGPGYEAYRLETWALVPWVF
jgi:protein-S-isoprenylcysteine O-methyltransferase Ste14